METITALLDEALALCQSGQLDEGQKIYLQILEREPANIKALSNLASIALHKGDLDESIALFKTSLSIDSTQPIAHYNYGMALQKANEFENALTAFDAAIELNVNFVQAYNNRGLTKSALKRHEEALVDFNHAIGILPDYAEAYNNRGITQSELKRNEEALADYANAIELNPDYAEAYSNRGGIFCELRRYDEALADLCHAIELNPDYAETYSTRGGIFCELRRHEEALKDFDRAFQLKPGMDYLLGALLHAKMHLCDWSNFHALLNKMTEHVIKQVKTITPFAALALIDNPELQKRTTEIYIKHLYSKNDAQPIVSKYPKHQKIRIGYFSADFREHPVSSLTVELFELHNRDQFEVIAFSFGANSNDPLRKRLEVGFDQFIDVSDKTDTQITLLAREMEIDIAVDLGGLTGGCRTGIFAARAAPVQVNYLGYPGTMSAEYMDYIIADPTLIPDEKQCDYSEKVAYLPNTYMVNDSSLQISEVPFSRKDVEIPEKAFVFACFNASYKITPATFLGWMRILSAIENSVLWLSSMNQTAKNNLQNLAVEQGIDKDRIIFASRMPSVSDHLNRIRLADLFLDTFPFNAHTTSNDALRVGLPVLTLMGESFPSRVAASLLNAVNLPELITTHQHEYEALAIDLGSHPEKLAHIKNKLKSNLETSPLCNTKLFAQHIESLYQVMYQRHHDELTPDHISLNN
jgi:predicted O-linked N-acetylglucosamine transferase (SPINDLY family)